MRSRSLRASLAGILLVPLLTATTARATNGPSVWVVDSMERVAQQAAPATSTTAQISAGRGEYESFQIIVAGASGALSNANVTVSDLSGPNGATLSHTGVSLFREWYVNVSSSSPNWGGSNQPLGPGEYPDGLIPFVDPSTGNSLSGGNAPIVAAPFSVAAGQNQPIWVDVYVPAGTPPGSYAGTYTVSSDQGSVAGQIALTVWAFTLAAKPALKSSFLFSTTVPQAVHEELLRNKLDPVSEPASEQSTLISNFGLESVDLPFFSGADVGNCTMSAAPSVSAIQAAAASDQSGLYLYAYSADEIGSCTNLYPTVQSWAQALHTAGVDNLVTMAPVEALFDDGSGTGRSAVDDWTVLPVEYDQSKSTIAMALAKGDKVWSYNTLVQDAYSPKWEIDFLPLNFRIQPGFLSATLSLSGLLYWRVDRWSPDPWMDVNNAGTYSSSNYPGEAQLLYPGQDVGIVGAAPSMRVKWLRDGVEDYDYYELLVQAGKGAWALQQIASIAPDWTGWTRDPAALSATRQVLGAALDQLGGGGAGSADGGGGGGDAAAGAGDGGGGNGGGSKTPDAGSVAGEGGSSGNPPEASPGRSQTRGGCSSATSVGAGVENGGLFSVAALALALIRRRRRSS